MNMKSTLCLFISILLIVFLLSGISLAEGNPKFTGPAAYFPVVNDRFDPVIEGVEIEHDFIVKNNGATKLNILKVETD